jgi:hypothetical protein
MYSSTVTTGATIVTAVTAPYFRMPPESMPEERKRMKEGHELAHYMANKFLRLMKINYQHRLQGKQHMKSLKSLGFGPQNYVLDILMKDLANGVSDQELSLKLYSIFRDILCFSIDEPYAGISQTLSQTLYSAVMNFFVEIVREKTEVKT